MASALGVPYLGELPMDANLTMATERGVSFTDAFPASAAALPFAKVLDGILAQIAGYFG